MSLEKLMGTCFQLAGPPMKAPLETLSSLQRHDIKSKLNDFSDSFAVFPVSSNTTGLPGCTTPLKKNALELTFKAGAILLLSRVAACADIESVCKDVGISGVRV